MTKKRKRRLAIENNPEEINEQEETWDFLNDQQKNGAIDRWFIEKVEFPEEQD